MGDDSTQYTLRERVLRPLDAIRGHLELAVSRINEIDPVHEDLPMGLDSAIGGANDIFVSEVFARIAKLVSFSTYSDRMPPQFSQYRLAEQPDALANAKVFFPKAGFADDEEAVFVTRACSVAPEQVHQQFAVMAQPREHGIRRVKVEAPLHRRWNACDGGKGAAGGLRSLVHPDRWSPSGRLRSSSTVYPTLASTASGPTGGDPNSPPPAEVGSQRGPDPAGPP